MAKDRIYASHYLDTPPEWYWTNGLHDACITSVEAYEFPFDYDKYIDEKDNYNRNLFVLKMDSEGALFDTSVTEIRLCNYKILTPEISLENRKAIWWLSDWLYENKNHYVLEIDLHDSDSRPEDFTFKIKFDRAEVKRNESHASVLPHD